MHEVKSITKIINSLSVFNKEKARQLQLNLIHEANSIITIAAQLSYSELLISIYSYKECFVIKSSEISICYVVFEPDEIILTIEELISNTGNVFSISQNRWWSYLPKWMFAIPEHIDTHLKPYFTKSILSNLNNENIWADYSERELSALLQWELHLNKELI